MANVNAADGFSPVRHLTGAPFNGQGQLCYLASGESNNIFIGDLVTPAGSADTVTGAPTVTRAAAGDKIAGAVIGFDVSAGLTPNLNIAYRPASTAMYVYVSTATDLIYEVQAFGTVSATDVGLNADLKTGTGSTTTNRSGFSLDSSTTSTTSTLGFHIMRAVQKPNNALGQYVRLEVIPNVHAYAPNTAGQ